MVADAQRKAINNLYENVFAANIQLLHSYYFIGRKNYRREYSWRISGIFKVKYFIPKC